jgi:O-methyltransferase
MPVIHAGDVFQTIPAELPERIAFAHIDLGSGSDVFEHTRLIVHGLSAIYKRMVPNGVMVFMDYHIPNVTVNGNDSNPGVRLACDGFFENKPEKIKLLYGGPCSHAYIRKQA